AEPDDVPGAVRVVLVHGRDEVEESVEGAERVLQSGHALAREDLMALLIKNAHVVNASEEFHADVYCAGEQVTRIEKGIDPKSCPAGTEVIDAAGKYVFPGFIDPHVHVYLPFMGTYAKDTWETASRAAIVGGTTTLIEMICPGKTDDA